MDYVMHACFLVMGALEIPHWHWHCTDATDRLTHDGKGNWDSAADDRLWMCITVIVTARDKPHIIITNRKYIPVQRNRTDDSQHSNIHLNTLY